MPCFDCFGVACLNHFPINFPESLGGLGMMLEPSLGVFPPTREFVIGGGRANGPPSDAPCFLETLCSGVFHP